MKWQTLMARLRRGAHPETDLKGMLVGEGCFKSAWKIGRYVVKGPLHPTDGHRSPLQARAWLKRRKPRVYVAPTWRVAQWAVQPYYRHTLTTDDEQTLRLYASDMDLGLHNVRFDRRRRPVAIDW